MAADTRIPRGKCVAGCDVRLEVFHELGELHPEATLARSGADEATLSRRSIVVISETSQFPHRRKARRRAPSCAPPPTRVPSRQGQSAEAGPTATRKDWKPALHESSRECCARSFKIVDSVPTRSSGARRLRASSLPRCFGEASGSDDFLFHQVESNDGRPFTLVEVVPRSG